MPQPDDVRDELADILVQLVGCAPEDVVDYRAELKQLGVDSLAIVEMADELGRRYDIYLSDDTVNQMRTVADAVAAVVRHDGARPPRSTTYDAAPPAGPAIDDAAPAATPAPVVEVDPEVRRSALRRLAFWFAAVGAAVGIVFGLGGAALIGATGLGSTTLPPLTLPSTPAPTTPTPTPTPTATPDPEETADPDPTLTIPKTRVSPGERFTLEGAFPGLDKGERLQVQVKDSGEG